MARIKIDIPDNFSFSTSIPIRITDINYGNHLGNDAVLSIIHEARMQFLKHYGLSELNFDGAGLIMSDAAIEFKNEGFYGEMIVAYVTAGEFTKVGFDLFYKLTKKIGEKEVIITLAKTGMICYNYDTKKVVAVPEEAKNKLSS
jgi:acyl-CoA thioesterase FadM